MKKLLTLGLLAAASATVMAKLPAPSEEAKAKAAEAAAKTAWTGKLEAYQLCKAQDKVAAAYYKSAKAAGKDTKPPAAAPACADPGPFAYTPPEAKPLEAAGAHSPAGNATSPPSTKQPDAVGNPAKKS
ncbi:hypothetical protein PMI15_04074 [Polaromonas sp. CF318]|uniref:hypothetical protein n=1 Tax=Polaromonas sp. CF318 TaxID=1144318 RepID=UPI0002713D82|nr:hypothetical protein [Polaromonas sp. CF318]EJL79085.1 hypothetical protein PMI15_04074 [Polaromonas sp. CF318]